MTSIKYLIPAVALAAGLVTASPGPAAAQTASTGSPTCSIRYLIGKETCYSPANVARAERGVPFAVNPSAAVARVLHLSLSQVIVWTDPNGGKHLRYLYGVLAPNGNYGGLTYANPMSLLVQEDRGQVKPQPVLTRLYGGFPMTVSRATTGQSAHWYGPWYLVANFPHRTVTLGLTANTSRELLMRLAVRILTS